MTELRTEGGGRLLTPRRDKIVNRQQTIDLSSRTISSEDGWEIYSFDDVEKKAFDSDSNKLFKSQLTDGATGLALVSEPFAEGVERFVYRCTELVIPDKLVDAWYYHGRGRQRAMRTGLRLVAKEAKAVENLSRGLKFHETFAGIQSDAAVLAQYFCKSLPSQRSDWTVTFLQTYIYDCYNEGYKDNTASVLLKAELDGKFTKWNNNAGAVKGKATATTIVQSGPSLGIGTTAVLEEEDEEDSDDEAENIEVDDVPQDFSHFTYEQSGGKKLVCDLQGVWNPDDGFVLTDPVVHYVSMAGKRHKNGATDKGYEGVKRFFGTHKCGPLCRKMKLQVRTADDLIFVPSGYKR
jgi:hypothetical protein